jgi:uncharacterized protein (DUF885 family)
MSRILFVLLISIGSFSSASPVKDSFESKIRNWKSQSGPASKKMNTFYEMYWTYLMTTYPEWATFQGHPGQNDRWSDLSQEAINEQKRITREVLSAIKTVSEKSLKGEELMSYRLLRYRLEEEVENQKFPDELLAINQMSGFHSELVDLMMMAPKHNAKDYADMLERLRKAPKVIDQIISLLQTGIKQGVTQPKITLAKLPAQFEGLLTAKVEDSPLFKHFVEIKPDVLPQDKADAVRTLAKQIITLEIYPALTKLRDFLVKDYIPQCREAIGWSALPQGQDWYNRRIKHHTTVDLTADQIFQLGNDEVLRIQSEMAKVRDQIGFKGDAKKFHETLKDSRFHFTRGEDLLERFRSIGKTIDPLLPQFFGRLPRLTYGIQEIPPFKGPASPAAYYYGGSLEAGRAGFFMANTYDLKARPKWGMIDLTCHEAVPGHHFQISLAQELENLPEIRKNMHFTSYVEGWGLYSEILCDEMGLYKDPYDKYGQLTAELWRAVRLVVDTGIHAKGWTRDQAVKYFREAGPFAEQEIQAETNRYIVWAGQALAYKIGELKIKELKEKSKKTLGEKFDIRKFHDEILGSGALPLVVLEKKMNEWTEAQMRLGAKTKTR